MDMCRKLWIATTFALAVLALIPGTLRAEPPITLVVIGDSLSAGYGLAKEEAFPARLETALRGKGHAVTVVNAGVSGDTTAGGRARLQWALGDDPDAVIVELGANDALRGLAPDQAYENLRAILTTLRDRSIPTLLAGMRSPPNLGEDYATRFEGIFDRLASEFDVVHYPFFLEGVAADPALNQDDGIHPNAAGVDVIVRNIMPRVEDLLERTVAARDGAGTGGS